MITASLVLCIIIIIAFPREDELRPSGRGGFNNNLIEGPLCFEAYYEYRFTVSNSVGVYIEDNGVESGVI